MARRDIDLLHALPGAQDTADPFPVVQEIRTAARFPTGSTRLSNQTRLGTTDRRDIKQDAEVTGEAEAPRVGVALAIDDEEIDRPADLRKGMPEHRHFSKREEPGHVRKRERALLDRHFEQR
jgi:hypothetical protein